ncbi:MAG TPA: Xaa-Pro peptidase family protein [Anaerolineae bacterium]|nr:Xaa-Pro peptidase family protein [Anaerolineae bacterium]
MLRHEDWVRTNLDKWSRSLGFRYTPREEIDQRLKKVREGMASKRIEALLVVQKMDYFYLSGTTQDSLLFVPVEGEPLLMVRRELERARVDSPLHEVMGFSSTDELPALIADHWGRVPGNLGLEFDVLPVRDYRMYGDLFPKCTLVDSSSIIKHARKIKTPFELELMKKGGEISRQVFEEARGFIKEGITEIEVGGLMDLTAKRYGHEGLTRVRSMNYEAYTWHVLSGPTGGIVSQSDSPMGGLGVSPAFPVGGSLKTLEEHEPILVDFLCVYHGYMVDTTRMFSLGKMEDKWIAAYDAMCRVHETVLNETRPGANCQELFRKSVRLAHELGYEDSYLGPPGLQTTFVAHGIGLELGEFPYLAEGHDYPLEVGMTFSVEPKVVFPGEGAIGTENTVVVTENGYEVLTPVPESIFVL